MSRRQFGIFLVALGILAVGPIVAMLAMAIYNTSFRPCQDTPYRGGHCWHGEHQIVTVDGAMVCRCPRP